MTERQKRFADEYLIDLNATRAYKAAYPSVKKDEAARVNGCRMLTNANIQAYIAERQRDRQERTEITQDMVVRELAAVAFADVTEIVEIDDRGIVCIKPTADLTEDQRRAIAGIKETKFGTEIKMNDKLAALELLGRHLGMFKDKVEVSGLAVAQSKLDALVAQMRGG